MRHLFAKGRLGPLICRYCDKDLDEGDALEYFIKRNKELAVIWKWGEDFDIYKSSLAEAKEYGWSEENKVHHIHYYNPDKRCRFSFQKGDEYMTDQICPFCKGILPLDTDEPREFYRTRATSWGSACYTTPFLHNGEIVERDNVFSPDKKYCYERLRVWEPKLEYALFILLNPLSEGNDDAGIRCVKLAQKQKFGGCYIVYLHSLITSDSKLLKNEDPISLETKKNTIEMILPKVKKVIYGWGSKAKPILKVREPLWLKEIISEPFCYGKTKEGYPCNPLTVDCDEKLIIFR